MKSMSRPVQNQRGQTLIEYLIIVALVGVGSIALVRTVSNQVNSKFASVVKSLGGNVSGKIQNAEYDAKKLNQIDMKNFASGALERKGKNQGSKNEDGDE